MDVDDESDVTELLVELRPVDSEPIELLAEDSPVDVEVESDVTELLVELRPVDNELIPVEVEVDSDVIELFADDRPVDAEVDKLVMLDVVVLATAKSWLPLIASVLVALTRPAATFWIRRSAFG